MGNLDRKRNQPSSADRRMKFRLTSTASWLSVFLAATLQSLLLLQHVSAQPGFLSVDCGATAPYVDSIGISWVPDDPYVSGGKTTTVVAESSDLKTLRYFPDSTRTRYCYSLPTTSGQTYLLRTRFYHGDYDSQPNIKFEVGLDIFQAKGTFAFTATDQYFMGEAVFQAFKDSVELCLYRLLPTDNPFISAIELRALDNSMYATVTSGVALLLQTRSNLGGVSPADVFLRYPADKYDRFWGGVSGSALVNLTSTFVVDSGYAVDKPPPAVMNTAVTNLPDETDPFIYFKFTPAADSANTYLVNVLLAELDDTVAKGRVFDCLVNGVVFAANVNIYSSAMNSMYEPVEFSSNASSVDADGNLNITLSKSALSVAPPLWNALEVYSIHSKLPATLAGDVTAIEGLKKAFGLGALWTGDPCLQLPYDWLTCTVGSPPRIATIQLSSANLSGTIPDLSALTGLTTLHLDNNSLTGGVPAWLATLPNLKELWLQNNQLTGNVPKALLTGNSNRFDGNPGLCVNTTCASENKPSSNIGLIIGVVVGVLLVAAIVLGVVVLICCRRRRRRGHAVEKKPYSPPLSQIALEEGTATRGSRYTLAQVMAATRNNARMLGKGGFGPVYYGKLASGQEVAVKVAAKGSGQGSKEFINEVELLTRVHHKNLVSLVGYCDEGDNLILLYEYMPLGTVQSHLYDVGDQPKEFFLDWKTRLQIALNSAQGLEYLHVGCQPIIFHRDVKSNNILLNDKLVAKVADFGLSKSSDSKENVTHMSTMVKGTIGYLDPEYFNSNQLTDKSDVYGFGIVLLELICARPPFVPQLPEEQRRIDQWVKPYLQAGTIEEIVDPALNGQYNLDAMWKMVDLAIQSVEPKGKHRPNMSTIVQELRGALDIQTSFESNANFKFDPLHSGASVSDTNFVGNSTVHAR